MSPSATGSAVVQDALRGVMVFVKETAVNHNLDKLVEVRIKSLLQSSIYVRPIH